MSAAIQASRYLTRLIGCSAVYPIYDYSNDYGDQRSCDSTYPTLTRGLPIFAGNLETRRQPFKEPIRCGDKERHDYEGITSRNALHGTPTCGDGWCNDERNSDK